MLQKYLPAESREHVKKFIATAYYFERADKANPSQKIIVQTVSTPILSTPIPESSPALTQESDNEKFKRLMLESAKSLKASNELLAN